MSETSGGQEDRRKRLTIKKQTNRMFIPVGNADMQYIWVIDKKENGSVERKKSFGVRYVPLTDTPAH